MPEAMSFEDAAPLPMVFTAGGVGQATLMLAKHSGAGEIYVTVGSQEKREFIKREYGIPGKHIFSNRNASFAMAIFLLDMEAFSRVASDGSLDMMTLLRHRRSDIHHILSEISRPVQAQVLAPARPVIAYSMSDTAKAFRLLQTGNHTGKIVLSTGPGDEVDVLPCVAATTRLRSDVSYLHVGGAGGLGRSIAHWLIDHGAKNLTLLSRSAEKSSGFVAELVQPKLYGTRNLHVQWSQPDSLDFIMLLSFSGILDNAYQDAIAHWRQARGLPCVSIDLGAVAGVGYVAETADAADLLCMTNETLMVVEAAVQQALQAAIAHPMDHPQILLGLNTGPAPQWNPQGKSQMSRDARSMALKYRDHCSQGSGLQKDASADGSREQTLSHKSAGAESRDTAAELVNEAIAAKLASIFMLPASDVDLAQPPAQCGIDSLVAVELRNMLMLQAAVEVSFTIMQSVSLTVLALDVVMKSR
ncbi:putative polyketide synthase [Annulohypoxylon truncatum]|uniref:putative polyketide synthase n=1 Tax=Annulohypoxylon truncatum TaxID=327061 RepID=UPI002007958C|nr:putative polyketide synthase [Annulohypoxylon truncatum]KAI1204311.1 putative polyketide synthase [Annulohypoxylon truncatum]